MNCKHCKLNLNDGNIFETLKQKYVYESDEKIKEKAYMYGWSETNNKCFSKEIIIQFDDKPQIVICPQCKVINPLKDDSLLEFFSI